MSVGVLACWPVSVVLLIWTWMTKQHAWFLDILICLVKKNEKESFYIMFLLSNHSRIYLINCIIFGHCVIFNYCSLQIHKIKFSVRVNLCGFHHWLIRGKFMTAKLKMVKFINRCQSKINCHGETTHKMNVENLDFKYKRVREHTHTYMFLETKDFKKQSH